MPSGSDKEYLACDILSLQSTATIRLALCNSRRYRVSLQIITLSPKKQPGCLDEFSANLISQNSDLQGEHLLNN